MRHTPTISSAIFLNPEASSPLYRQLYEGLRQNILAGKLVPGQRVPSTRELSQSLEVSRNTVAQSYAQLLSEGYLQTTVGSGTFICRQLPDDLSEATTPGRSLIDFDPFVPPEPEALINFRSRRPALDEFPFRIWHVNR